MKHRNIILILLLNVFFLVVCFRPIVEAHEDPVGEIHPWVSVEGEKFVINYRVHMPPQQKPEPPAVYEWTNEYYRVTYDKKGNLLRSPEKVSPGKKKVSSIDVILPEELTGFTINDGDGMLVIPEWYRKHEGKPFFVSVKEGKYNKRPIEWGANKIDMIHDAISVDRYIVLLLTQTDKKDFEFVAIDKETTRIEMHHSLGVPRRIYDFPVSSNLLVHNRRVLVAWIEEDGARFALNLSSWDLSRTLLSKRNLTREADWNTSLSMARIEDVALLAYHYGPHGYSVIKVIRIDLTEH